ncbi:MAG: hypothetical protein QOF01_5221 [Thermomicrobiales bacterium]|nr:hypothetical protein [Thermomicrobiales bacterium]
MDEKSRDQGRVVQGPEIMVGKPVVQGTRIPVERVIGQLAENHDLDELFASFPELTIEDVKASRADARTAVARRSARAARKTLASLTPTLA